MALTYIWGYKLRRKSNLDVSGENSSVFTIQVLVGSPGEETQWAYTVGIMVAGRIKVKNKDLEVTNTEIVDAISK